MGFVDYNSFGKFQAETDLPLPSFSAESLMSLPSKQFGAATVDADSVSNYEEDHWSSFVIDKSGYTDNESGGIVTRSDKGFQFTNKADSGKVLGIKLTDARDRSQSHTFSLNPGDTIKRDGGYSTVTYVPAGGTESVDGVVTVIPWMVGWRSTDPNVEKKFSNTGSKTRHNYFLDVLPATAWVDPDAGTNGDNGTNGSDPVSGCTSVTATNYNSTATIDDGSCIEPSGDGDEEEDSPNYLLYGAGIALLAVGGFMASKMMKK
ncbi:hypothetical protein CMK18_22820 [Candidatus Poribacteria bacterium]|nr:hypothetical protein [Candidatus Poribacteria bacterium]